MNSSSSESAAAAALRAAILRAHAALPTGTRDFAVAYSGGADSTALLHALHALWPDRVRALHVHHGLHPEADAWAEHCRRSCSAAGIALQVMRVDVVADGNGPEAAARTARYRALEAVLLAGEVLVTAHHADDQAETVLFRLLRGGGPNGARGLRALRRTRAAWLWRPLLAVPKTQLESYCVARGLTYVTDPQNSDGSNVRGRLRAVLADCAGWVPGATESLCTLAGQLAEQHELIHRQVDPMLAARMTQGRLDVRGLLGWSSALRHALLRRYCEWLLLPTPGSAWLARCDAELLGARQDAMPRLRLGDAWLRRFDQQLWAVPELETAPSQWRVCWNPQQPLQLPGDAGSLRCIADVPTPSLTVRFAQPGETALALHARFGTARLKTVFNRQRIPPWERERTPVVSAGDQLLQIGNWSLQTGAEAGARDGAQSLLLWEKPRWHRIPQAESGPENTPDVLD